MANKKKEEKIDISKFEFISNELRKIENPEIKKGYLKFACPSAEDKTALLATYSANYPEDTDTLEFIAREIEENVKDKDKSKKDEVYHFNPLDIFKYIKELAEDLAILYGRAFKLAIENLEYLAPKRKAEAVNDMPEAYKPYLKTGAEIEKEYYGENYTVIPMAEVREKANAEKSFNSKRRESRPTLLDRIKGLFANRKPKVEKVSHQELQENLALKAQKDALAKSETEKRARYEKSLAERRKAKEASISPAEKTA